MDWSIAPSLIEETTGAIQVVEVRFILIAAEELHITNLEIGPEVARRISLRITSMIRPQLSIRQPLHHIILMQICRVRSQELLRSGPKVRDTFGRVEEVNREPVRHVVILHVPENVVVHVAEVLDLRLNAPVVSVVLEGGVLVEHAAVPSAHLAVGDFVAVLDILFFEDRGGFAEEVHVYPVWDIPVLLRDEFWVLLVC